MFPLSIYRERTILFALGLNNPYVVIYYNAFMPQQQRLTQLDVAGTDATSGYAALRALRERINH